ncbi:MAG: hypothetical protein H0W99_12740 [Acidobacteria bacterium]|nr:hypothetical protein [Acidobacteriota bacterium]
MTKKDVQKLAEEYVMKHKEHYGTVPKRELKQAVDKVAKVLGDLTVKSRPGRTVTKSSRQSRVTSPIHSKYHDRACRRR